jgi:hypothetical protein
LGLGGGTFCNIINKDIKAVYLNRKNYSKAFHNQIAFDMSKTTKSDEYKLKDLISVPLRLLSFTVPIGDEYHEFSACNITTCPHVANKQHRQPQKSLQLFLLTGRQSIG